MSDYQIEDLLFIPANSDGEKTATDMTIIGDVDMLGSFSIMQGKGSGQHTARPALARR